MTLRVTAQQALASTISFTYLLGHSVFQWNIFNFLQFHHFPKSETSILLVIGNDSELFRNCKLIPVIFCFKGVVASNRLRFKIETILNQCSFLRETVYTTPVPHQVAICLVLASVVLKIS